MDRLENRESSPVFSDFSPSSEGLLLRLLRQQNQTSPADIAAARMIPTAMPAMAPVDNPFDGVVAPGPGHELSSGLEMAARLGC